MLLSPPYRYKSCTKRSPTASIVGGSCLVLTKKNVLTCCTYSSSTTVSVICVSPTAVRADSSLRGVRDQLRQRMRSVFGCFGLRYMNRTPTENCCDVSARTLSSLFLLPRACLCSFVELIQLSRRQIQESVTPGHHAHLHILCKGHHLSTSENTT